MFFLSLHINCLLESQFSNQKTIWVCLRIWQILWLNVIKSPSFPLIFFNALNGGMYSAMISPSPSRKKPTPSGDLPRSPRYALPRCSRWTASSSPPCSLAMDCWDSKGSPKMQLCISLIHKQINEYIYIYVYEVYSIYRCGFCIWIDMDYLYTI